MKKFKSSIPTSMERAAIWVAPSGKAATKVFAALLVLELAAGTIGCSKSKPVAQNSLESSNQTVATAPVAAVPAATPVTASQQETAQKKSVKGPVRKLPRTLLYTDADSGFSFAYPRNSTLRAGQRAELQAIGMEWLPMDFVQQGGTTVTMVELPGTNGQVSSGEFFSVSVHNGLTAEQCGSFAGESAANSDDKAAAISRVSLHGFEYSELNRQTEQGTAKYYHRFVPGSGEISSCYEFTLAVRASEKKADGEEASVNSQVEKKDDFARLQRVLASVKIKADSEPVKVAATKDNAEVPSTTSNSNQATDSAKTVAKSDASPR